MVTGGIIGTMFFLGAGILAWAKVIGIALTWALVGGVALVLEGVARKALRGVAGLAPATCKGRA